MKRLTAPGRHIAPIITAAVLGFGIATGSAAPVMAQANDPSVPCDKTNNQWGDSEFCYIGPRAPKTSARGTASDTGDPAQARAHATVRDARPGGNGERTRRRGTSVPD
jgi:hypothetical protein